MVEPVLTEITTTHAPVLLHFLDVSAMVCITLTYLQVRIKETDESFLTTLLYVAFKIRLHLEYL